MYTARIETIEGENFIHGARGERRGEIIGTPEWEGYELSHSGGITKEQLNAAYTELTRKLSTYLHKIYRWDSFLGAEPEHRPGLRLFAHPN